MFEGRACCEKKGCRYGRCRVAKKKKSQDDKTPENTKSTLLHHPFVFYLPPLTFLISLERIRLKKAAD